MRPHRVLVLLLCLGLASCLVQLLAFDVPAQVRTGQRFEVTVTGTATMEGFSEDAAAVLQLPAGFTVVNAGTNNSAATVRRDVPALLSLYTAEAGHFLAGFSGAVSTGASNPVVLRLLLQAPPTPGPYTLKVALAGVRSGSFAAQDPAGVTDFTQVTAAPHARPTLVVPGGPPAAEFSLAVNGLPWYSTPGWGGIAFGDVDRDGRDDLAAIARLGNGPHVYLAQAGGSWLEQSAGLAGSSGRSNVAFGDFNRDGRLDLGDGNGNAFLGNGGSGWTRANTGIVIRGGGMEGVAVGDANGDGFDDIAFAGHFSGFAQVFLSNGQGGWTEASTGLPNQNQGSTDGGHKLLLRDVTGDGRVDVVWSRYYQPNVWAGDGRGSWTAGTGFGPHQFWGMAAGDLDGDGQLELVCGVFDLGSGQGGGGVQVYRRTGANAWSLVAGTGLPGSGMVQDVALTDFDRDGSLDLVFGSYGSNGGLSLWRGNGNATFTPWTGSGLPVSGLTNVEGLAVGDINGDTFPDLAAAVYGMGVAVWVNERTGFSRYAAGCQGTLPRVPAMGALGGPPRLGNLTFHWSVSSGPPGTAALLWLGADKTRLFGLPLLPLDLAPAGAPGCQLVAPPLLFFATALDGSGAGSVPMPIPNDQALLQSTLFGQWGVTAPGANALGLVFSGGGAARVGW